MTKVVPINSSEEDEAAKKMQSMYRGNKARSDAPVDLNKVKDMQKRMERNATAKFDLSTAKLGGSAKWGAVRQATGIKFDSWDMALQVVDAGWRGALQREVERQVREKFPDNPWGKVLLVIIAYFAGYFCIRDHMKPPDDPILSRGFAVVLIWVCSTLGGKLMQQIGMPGLLGNLLSGLLLKNIMPYPGGGYDYDSAECPNVISASGSASASATGRRLAGGGVDYSNPQWCVSKSVNGLPDEWASDIITVGLTIIFMRGGLELDIDLVKKAGMAAIRLTVMPGVCEAIVVGGFATIIFGMHFMLGLSLGFILAAVSPAVVVGAMFELKKKGYGVKQNIPTLVVAAASMDDVVAISGFAVCIAFAIPNKGSTTTTVILNAVHGPLTVIMGIVLGLIFGNVAAMTKVWDAHWKRVAIVGVQGFFLSFGCKTLERE